MRVAADEVPSSIARCSTCNTEIGTGVLVCPGCHRFVHATALADLKERADAAAATGDVRMELQTWRSALTLLPPGSRQHAAITDRVEALVRQQADSAAIVPEVPKTGPWKWLSGLGAFGVLLWKFKFLLVELLGKGKLLLLGLTKISTLLSMLAAFSLYWTMWGMWFALGFVLSIYVHEMGHVAALRRFGLAATAPMFVPGLGAFIRLRGRHLTPYENARTGLAGPVWGLGAAIAALAASRAGAGLMWAAVAHTGAWVNLFNLMPVWQLDGSRGFSALSKMQRITATLAFAVAWMITSDGLLVLLVIVAAARILDRHAPEAPDHGALAQFAAVTIALAFVFHSASATAGLR